MREKPSNSAALRDIMARFLREGYTCNLNDIDVSCIANFPQLFKALRFHSDISKWGVYFF